MRRRVLSESAVDDNRNRHGFHSNRVRQQKLNHNATVNGCEDTTTSDTATTTCYEEEEEETEVETQLTNTVFQRRLSAQSSKRHRTLLVFIVVPLLLVGVTVERFAYINGRWLSLGVGSRQNRISTSVITDGGRQSSGEDSYEDDDELDAVDLTEALGKDGVNAERNVDFGVYRRYEARVKYPLLPPSANELTVVSLLHGGDAFPLVLSRRRELERQQHRRHNGMSDDDGDNIRQSIREADDDWKRRLANIKESQQTLQAAISVKRRLGRRNFDDIREQQGIGDGHDNKRNENVLIPKLKRLLEHSLMLDPDNVHAVYEMGVFYEYYGDLLDPKSGNKADEEEVIVGDTMLSSHERNIIEAERLYVRGLAILTTFIDVGTGQLSDDLISIGASLRKARLRLTRLVFVIDRRLFGLIDQRKEQLLQLMRQAAERRRRNHSQRRHNHNGKVEISRNGRFDTVVKLASLSNAKSPDKSSSVVDNDGKRNIDEAKHSVLLQEQINDYFRQIHATAAMEGNTLSVVETEDALRTGLVIPGKTIREHQELMGIDLAFRYVNASLLYKMTISETDLKQLHRRIIGFVDPLSAGYYRTNQVFVSGYTPPHHSEISKLMCHFVKWLNANDRLIDKHKQHRARLERDLAERQQHHYLPHGPTRDSGHSYLPQSSETVSHAEFLLANAFLYNPTANGEGEANENSREDSDEGNESKMLHPIELAAIAHYKLSLIHPFADGNGRTARMLMMLVLMKQGYPPVSIPLTLRQRYYDTLRLANEGDVRPFIRLIAECVDRATIQYLQKADAAG